MSFNLRMAGIDFHENEGVGRSYRHPGLSGGRLVEQNIFDDLMNKPIFKGDREILRASYIPNELPHRQMQIQQLAQIMVTALRGERPSNVLIFGKTGTGKTAVIKYLGNEIRKADSELNRVLFLYINCRVVDTQYGVLQTIGNQFITNFDERIPFTGWSTERVYSILRDKIDESNRVIIIVLDEIDKLVSKSGDDVLYHLSKINDDLVNARVSMIGISNDLKFTEFLDPRVKSRLGEEKMVFPPYNAEQLQDILRQRASMAFDQGVLEESVIPLCAALAAQDHGDARAALDLLRIAAEIAERDREARVVEAHVFKAKNRVELDCITEAIKTLPTQSKLVLYSIIHNEERRNGRMTTGEVHMTYRDMCNFVGFDALTQRRVTDLISELDMLGIIRARVKSFGRGGRTKEIEAAVPLTETKNTLEEDEVLQVLKNYRPKNQMTII